MTKQKRLIAATTFRCDELQLWRRVSDVLDHSYSPKARVIVRQPAYRSLKRKFRKLQAKADRFSRQISPCQPDKNSKIKCQKPQ